MEVGLLNRELVHLNGPAGEWARAVRRGNLALLCEIIEAGQATGEFRAADTNILAHQIIGSIAVLAEWYRPTGGPITVAKLVDEVVAWILSGVGAPPQAVPKPHADGNQGIDEEHAATATAAPKVANG